jgi:hypothetical protein
LNPPDNRVAKWLLVLLALFSLALFLVPAFIIRPFTHQSESGLRLALAVKRVAPSLTPLAVLGVLTLAWGLWRRSSRLLRTGILASLLLCLASAVMVRQNYFEWMFNPIKAAGFVSPGDSHLDDKEMVMTVKIGSEARAYPIVQMAYHHILNDTVAGEPIVVTY